MYMQVSQKWHRCVPPLGGNIVGVTSGLMPATWLTSPDWVSEFAPPRYQKGLSYLTGWLCATGWQVFLASVAFMVAGIIQGLIALNNPDYSFQSWHATFLTIALMAFAIVFNTVLAVRLPLVEGIILVLHTAGFFAIFIPLWWVSLLAVWRLSDSYCRVLAPRAHASDVLFTFSNNGGWPTTGLSAMIGLMTPITALIGYDCSVSNFMGQGVARRLLTAVPTISRCT